MKISSKPNLSPSQTEKFPPPLMRFLSSNVGSRSRGRSRTSPMFVRRKNAAIETHEPSSPKVTCIGQVRVRRSKKATTKARRTIPTDKSRYRWIRKTLFCNNFTRKLKPRTFWDFWRRWFVFFKMGCRRKVEIMESSVKIEMKREGIDVKSVSREEEEKEEEEEEEEEESRVFDSISPPTNALLLMRSRSAPYRASSLASRFWEEKTEQENRENFEKEEEEAEERNPTSNTEPICRDSAAESITDPEIEKKIGLCRQLYGSGNERIIQTTKIEDESSKIGGIVGDSARPLILTRCKSEPARRSSKLDSETCFWRKRRFVLERFPPHVSD